MITSTEGPATGRPAVSDAERRVLEAVVSGLSQKETAHRLGLARATVQFHLVRLRGRLGARSVPQLAARAAVLGLVELRGAGVGPLP